MGFQDQLKLDMGAIVYGEFSETVVYGDSSVSAIVSREGVGEAYFEDGRGEPASLSIEVTDDSQLAYPGVAAPAIGDVATVDGETWRVAEVARGDMTGTWRLGLRRFDKVESGPGREGSLKRF